MKKNLTRYKTNISKIPYTKTSIHKISLDLSIPVYKKNTLKNKNDSINKDTVEGSIIETQTLAFNQDSLNNTKVTLNKNHSLGKLDNKLMLFTSSLNYSLNKKNKISNFSKNNQHNTNDDCSENISSSNDDIISMGKIGYIDENEDTNKIDYRYYPKIPEIEGNIDKNNPYYWLATYDKLMKKSKIAKILNYYSDSLSHKESEIFIIEDANSDYKEEEIKERNKKMNEKYAFKEKTMIIQGYEIYFVKKHGKPFIRQKKGGKLFIKLYLLNLEEINQIFSYINRLEYKQYINNLDSFKERNSYKIINNFNKSIYNYSTIFCLGTFMNINIYSFSHFHKIKDSSDYNENYIYNINDLPSSTKIAKIIKALMMNFPDFSKQYFIDYLMKPKDKNFEMDSHDSEILQQKMSEVNALLVTDNKKNYKINVNNTNNIIKNVIKGIPTYTPTSFNSVNNELNTITKTNNVSAINNIDKNTSNQLNSNNPNMNCSDFLSNIKNELDGISKICKDNNKDEDEYKKPMNKILNKKVLNNTSCTRNNINTYFNNNVNESSIQTIYSLKGIINKNNKICKTISIINPVKKSLTRTNSNNYIHYKKTKNVKTTNNSSEKINNFIKNKENDYNILNKNLISEYMTENNKSVLNNNIYKIYMKSESNIAFKSTRNKNNIYSPYYTNNNTNTNSINKDKDKDSYSQNNKNIKLKKPTRVLSSIRKVISQKMNNISENSNSLCNINKSDSSFKEIKKNSYINDNSNHIIIQPKNKRIVCKTNNNSQNKKSEYITPLKKKFLYYYH